MDPNLDHQDLTISSFGQDLLEKLENLARDLTKKRVENKKFNKVSTQSLSEGVTGISTTDTGTEDASGQLKGGRRKKGNQSNGATRPAPEIEAVVPKEGKGKRRAGKSKGEKVSGEAVAGVSKGFKSGTGPNSANDEDNIFTVEFLTSKILEWFPDLESAGIGNDLFQSGHLIAESCGRCGACTCVG